MNDVRTWVSQTVVCLMVFVQSAYCAERTPDVEAPANTSLKIIINESGIASLLYNGQSLGQVQAVAEENNTWHKCALVMPSHNVKLPDETYVAISSQASYGDRGQVHQRLSFERKITDGPVKLEIKITASEEAFAAETRTHNQNRFPLVRTTVGRSFNFRNNAIYDRRWDWVFAVDSGDVFIEPGDVTSDSTAFTMTVTGDMPEIDFKPRFYQKHKNLSYFEPWTYRVWKASVTGWCSWWPYRTGCTQKDVDEVAAALANHRLPDFGYKYLQLDDGFQRPVPDDMGDGMPNTWLHWNNQFPRGMHAFCGSVKEYGFEPGVWIYALFNNQFVVDRHPEWFAQTDDGNPMRGGFVNYVMDATNPDTAENLIKPVYQGFKKSGFKYVKIDALRHFFYDGHVHAENYSRSKGMTAEDMLRAYLGEARKALGDDTYILGCWGVLPAIAGIVDGCRLGGDGFGPSTLQQYSSWNGVVWRNDPDHCDIRPEGVGTRKDTIIRPALVAMAGAVLMVSDKAEVYQDPRDVEGMKRSSPVLFTVPGQLYDYDPVKTDAVVRGERAMMGYFCTSFDADQYNPVCRYWLQEIDCPFEHWYVLGRFHFDNDTQLLEETLRFADMGLEPNAEYLVYEFWTGRFLGVNRGSFVAPETGPNTVQIFAIRKRVERPQIVSTTRHVSQGGVDLKDVNWDDHRRSLSGESAVIADDPYTLSIFVPKAFKLKSATFGGRSAEVITEEQLVRVTFVPSETCRVNWSILFAKE